MDGRSIAKQLLPRIFEDEHYLFVNKPAGLAVNTPWRGCKAGVIEAAEALGIGAGLRACFKLEKSTSGVLVVGKSPTAVERFADGLKSGGGVLTYVAVVRGQPRQSSSADRLRRARSDRSGGPRKADQRKPSHMQVLKQFDRRALVRMTARESGGARIRAALRAMGTPVLDDARFDLRPDRTQAGRFYLHLEEISFQHPFTGETTRVKAPTPGSFERAARGESKLEAHLEAALATRIPCLLDDATDAFRLFNGKVDGVSGLLAEKLGPVIILHARQGKFQEDDRTMAATAQWYRRRLDARAVFVKRIPRDRSRGAKPNTTPAVRERARRRVKPDSPNGSKPILGSLSEAEIEVREHGIKYLVRPNDGYMTGLFLDHRENRARMRKSARGKHVLNLFSHTCGFSVAAAVGGAATTTSVDLSKKVLEWGKRNFEVNGLALTEHRFYCCDVFDYFKRAQRQGRRFDVIVVDPPTFARTKKPARVFQVVKDIARVLDGALELLQPPGLMLVATNHADLSHRWLRERVAAAAGKRSFRIVETPSVPPDFAGGLDAAKSVWVRFD